MKKTHVQKCSYHLCKRTGGNGGICKYCNKYYCDEHLTATPPAMPFGKDHGIWEQKGHPCPDYIEISKAEREAAKERESEALERLLMPSKNRRLGKLLKQKEIQKYLWVAATVLAVLLIAYFLFGTKK